MTIHLRFVQGWIRMEMGTLFIRKYALFAILSAFALLFGACASVASDEDKTDLLDFSYSQYIDKKTYNEVIEMLDISSDDANLNMNELRTDISVEYAGLPFDMQLVFRGIPNGEGKDEDLLGGEEYIYDFPANTNAEDILTALTFIYSDFLAMFDGETFMTDTVGELIDGGTGVGFCVLHLMNPDNSGCHIVMQGRYTDTGEQYRISISNFSGSFPLLDAGSEQ